MVAAYIDESGNLGRGGDYFVLTAVVFDDRNGKNRIKRIIRKEQRLVAKEKRFQSICEIKACRLSFEQCQRIVNKIYIAHRCRFVLFSSVQEEYYSS